MARVPKTSIGWFLAAAAVSTALCLLVPFVDEPKGTAGDVFAAAATQPVRNTEPASCVHGEADALIRGRRPSSGGGYISEAAAQPLAADVLSQRMQRATARGQSQTAPAQQTTNKPRPLAARGDAPSPADISPWMNFTATWYSPAGGQGDGHITATGSHVKNNWTIAVDPHVIPLYSLVEIRFANGERHLYQALDTGGAIVGHKVDIFDDSQQSCIQHGVQPVQLRIVRRGR